jgi:hypothetical protein
MTLQWHPREFVSLAALSELAAPVAKLRHGRIMMPGCLLPVFQLRAVFKRGRDERPPHRMGGITAIEAGPQSDGLSQNVMRADGGGTSRRGW